LVKMDPETFNLEVTHPEKVTKWKGSKLGRSLQPQVKNPEYQIKDLVNKEESFFLKRSPNLASQVWLKG